MRCLGRQNSPNVSLNQPDGEEMQEIQRGGTITTNKNENASENVIIYLAPLAKPQSTDTKVKGGFSTSAGVSYDLQVT